MIRLRAKKTKGKYKNTDAWLNAVYRNNRTLIDKALPATQTMSSKRLFKEWVRSYQQDGYTAFQSVKRLARSEIFTDRKVRLQENFLKGLKQDKEAFNAFRRAVGWNKKIDASKLEYDYATQSYTYDDVQIDVDQSPKGQNSARFKITT